MLGYGLMRIAGGALVEIEGDLHITQAKPSFKTFPERFPSFRALAGHDSHVQPTFFTSSFDESFQSGPLSARRLRRRRHRPRDGKESPQDCGDPRFNRKVHENLPPWVRFYFASEISVARLPSLQILVCCCVWAIF